jgi:MATE family multidrug resistance protein
MTITFNWDMVAFIPVIGVGVGATSLVGRYMGAGKPSVANRAAYSAIKTALGYTLTVLVFFVFAPHLLVGMFTPHRPGLDYSAAAPLAVFMIRMASLYLVSDALMLVFGGALRGAGGNPTFQKNINPISPPSSEALALLTE